jgi:hypothetical protein
MSIQLPEVYNFVFGGQRIELTIEECRELREFITKLGDYFETLQSFQQIPSTLVRYVSDPYVDIDVKGILYKVSIAEIVRTTKKIKNSKS